MSNIVVKDCGSERVISISADHLNNSGAVDSLSRHLANFFESGDSLVNPDSKSFDRPGEFAEAADDSGIETLTLNFELVAWLSSEGLNELISINRQARTRGVRLVLSNVQEPVRKVFALTRLERMFELSEPQAQIV